MHIAHMTRSKVGLMCLFGTLSVRVSDFGLVNGWYTCTVYSVCLTCLLVRVCADASVSRNGQKASRCSRLSRFWNFLLFCDIALQRWAEQRWNITEAHAYPLSSSSAAAATVCCYVTLGLVRSTSGVLR